MKKLVLVLCAIEGICLAESQYAVSVTETNSIVIAPRATPPRTYTLWATNTAVVNGEYIRVSDTKRYYMCVVAGTTGTNAPTATAAQNGLITDGTAELAPVAPNGRKMLFATQESDASIWYHVGSTATTNGGEFAYTKGQQFSYDGYDEVSAYSTSAVKINITDK